MPSAEIITIGTEILLGEIVDTNTRHIARTLRDLGIDLYRTVTIGDNVGRIADAIRHSMDRAEIVITTGGLGPTVDDPTREAVARAAGKQLEFRDELWEDVRATIARYGRRPTENQRRQAYVPQGSIVIQNPVGTAPAFIVETGPGAVIALPGVPGEMELLLHESVVPYLQKRFELRNVIKVRLLHTAGQGEGAIDEKIGDLETLTNPTVGLAAHNGVVDIRLAAKAETEAEAQKMIASVEAEVRSRLGEIIFGVDEDDLHAVTLAAVGARSWPLTIAAFGIPEALLSGVAPVVSLAGLRKGDLADRLGALRVETGSVALLGMAVFESEMALEIAVLTPVGEKNVRLTYGGHPRNLPRWALNTGMNMLRLLAQAKQ